MPDLPRQFVVLAAKTSGLTLQDDVDFTKRKPPETFGVATGACPFLKKRKPVYPAFAFGGRAFP